MCAVLTHEVIKCICPAMPELNTVNTVINWPANIITVINKQHLNYHQLQNYHQIWQAHWKWLHVGPESLLVVWKCVQTVEVKPCHTFTFAYLYYFTTFVKISHMLEFSVLLRSLTFPPWLATYIREKFENEAMLLFSFFFKYTNKIVLSQHLTHQEKVSRYGLQ